MIYEVFPRDNTYLKRCESNRAQENAQVLKMDCNTGGGTTTGGGGGTGGGSCDDQNTNCGYWAGEGYCTSNAAYMDENCKKSCNKCGTTTTTGGGTGGGTGACDDQNTNCGYWAGEGYCTSNAAYMDENCKKSCNKCGTTTGG